MADPVILAIDTCEGTCSAALVHGGETIVSRMERIGRGHAERLLPMIDEMLSEVRLSYDAIGRIAVCTGPGTFTGLRIGLSVARGLALSLDIPCVGLTGLQVLAATPEAAEAPVHAIVMGRGGQGYYQSFRSRNDLGLPQPVSEAASLDAGVIAAHVAEMPGVVVGSGAPLVGEASPVDAIDPTVLARLAVNLDPADFQPEPAYLREADAKKGKALFAVQG